MTPGVLACGWAGLRGCAATASVAAAGSRTRRRRPFRTPVMETSKLAYPPWPHSVCLPVGLARGAPLPFDPRKTHLPVRRKHREAMGSPRQTDRRFADHHRRTVVAAHGDEGPAIALRRACTFCLYGCSRESPVGTHAGSTGASPAKGIGLRASLNASRASMVTGVVCP